ncbi:hypothetical protein B0H12DRAFT_1135219 [Mycena haematopus]|nr:hypothetical protein B0H12DRAFT_1135219 [Mycena haematopus]
MAQRGLVHAGRNAQRLCAFSNFIPVEFHGCALFLGVAFRTLQYNGPWISLVSRKSI